MVFLVLFCIASVHQRFTFGCDTHGTSPPSLGQRPTSLVPHLTCTHQRLKPSLPLREPRYPSRKRGRCLEQATEEGSMLPASSTNQCLSLTPLGLGLWQGSTASCCTYPLEVQRHLQSLQQVPTGNKAASLGERPMDQVPKGSRVLGPGLGCS